VGLERGPLSLVSTTEELLGRKSSGCDLENREYGRRGYVTLTTWLKNKAKASEASTGGKLSVLRSDRALLTARFLVLNSVRHCVDHIAAGRIR
jgi:hypothetical protein